MSKYDARNYALRKSRMLGREANEVHLMGKITHKSPITKRMNGDTVIQFKVATHSPTYKGFKYETITTEHNVLARTPEDVETVQLLDTYDYVEVIGHLTYSKSTRGLVAEVIASSVTFREDLMPTTGVKPKSQYEPFTEYCGVSEITDDDSEEVTPDSETNEQLV